MIVGGGVGVLVGGTAVTLVAQAGISGYVAWATAPQPDHRITGQVFGVEDGAQSVLGLRAEIDALYDEGTVDLDEARDLPVEPRFGVDLAGEALRDVLTARVDIARPPAQALPVAGSLDPLAALGIEPVPPINDARTPAHACPPAGR